MKKNLKADIFAIALVFAIVFCLPKSLKADTDLIDASFNPLGPINQLNIAPGDAFHKILTVKNKTKDNLNLAIKVVLSQPIVQSISGNLEEVIFIQIRNSIGDIIYGGGWDKTLGGLKNNPFNFDMLGPDETKTFTLDFIFDPNAGNEYQNKEISFDISAGVDAEIESKEEDNEDNDGDDNGGGTDALFSAASGFFSPSAFGTASEVAGVSEPESKGKEDIIEVKGEETQCEGWPFWVWMLMLAAFAVILQYNFYKKDRNGEAGNDPVWKMPAVWAAAIFSVWYFFEKCRLYPWYPYVIVIIAGTSFFIYLSILKKRVKNEERV